MENESNKYIIEGNLKYLNSQIIRKCLQLTNLAKQDSLLKPQNVNEFKNCYIKFNILIKDVYSQHNRE